MDKNKIKSFAIWARRSLIEAVKDRAKYIGIFIDDEGEFKELKAKKVQGGFSLENTEKVFNLSYDDREILISKINEHTNKIKGFEQVMEETAYTWFNRFMGLRYMEVNDYLPSGVRILSSEVEGKKEPDVLTKVSEIIDELSLNANEIYELLDTGDTLDREKAYRIILVKQCNELGKIIPQMFEKISDYTELLLPDNLLEEGSVIRKMVEDIEESDWLEEVEIIGWMYQYYISEKKDEVFAALKKNVKITKENIPAATQLFTPKWIVKYMVENSLGRLWLEGHPNEELQKEWKYYLEEAEQEPEAEEQLNRIREEYAKLSPENIKVLDPCMGSGHILVYAFDVLYEIYKTAGYSEREIPRMILQNNIYGLDIDDRASQLASFALIMKARHYNRRLFREIERENLELNLCSIQESNSINKEAIDYFVGENEDLRKDFEYLVEVFIDAKEYGSILEVKGINFEAIEKRLSEIKAFETTNSEGGFEFPIEFPLQIDVFEDRNRNIVLEMIPIIVKQGKIMSRKYEVCVTNPPYMGNKGMNNILTKYVEEKYPNTKGDMCAVFIERGFEWIVNNGFNTMITMHSWMFLGSFENFRKSCLNKYTINSILHLGMEAFDGIVGKIVQTAAFVMTRSRNEDYTPHCVRLVDFYDSRRYEKENQFYNKNNHFSSIMQSKFNLLPGTPFAYWISNNIINIFENSTALGNISDVKKGMDTGNNEKYLRLWFEIENNKFSQHLKNGEETINLNIKWVPYNKGGKYRKWYGNLEYVLDWSNNGSELKNSKRANLRSKHLYFKESLTWTLLGSSDKFAIRYVPVGSIFDSNGSSIFFSSEIIKYVQSFCNSKVSKKLIEILSPTMAFNISDVAKLPIIICENKESINNLSDRNILIARNDWDYFETSWDFKVHPLLKFLDEAKDFKLSSSFEVWENECELKFNQLKDNEEELNRIFIDIYGLQDELTPEVEDKDVTIRKADRERDIKSFISYAVGCMFGRYSIDSEGLIYAGGDFNDKWRVEDAKAKVKSSLEFPEIDLGEVREWYIDADGFSKERESPEKIDPRIEDVWIDARFMPDRDNVIPITEDEYFEDDIVVKFIEFVKIVYGEETLEENLDYIADSIGRKASETARQAIRRYFIKDFYKDHLKVYQKRPIYWMFESGKNDGFKCLVYMHRYNEQTVAKIRTDYLHTLQRKYESEINRLQLVVDSEEYTTKDRTAAKKKIDRISKQIEECREYDQVVAYLANEKISIDLDDGVKVNYAKFQDIKVINSKGKETKMNLLAKF